ncbi:MAG TPA: dihydropteroate synthase [Acidimicrobiales bacterium]|nr:dihydropteroate synthase [Acidimicrobiales bacterium]
MVMGVLNVTPDSFSDGGAWMDRARAVEHGLQLVADGADVVDVGGESTRPGAGSVPVDDELRRVVPVVEALAGHTRVSVDTRKAAVAEAAIAAGATIVNDVSAELWPIAAAHGVGWIAMHMPADPSVMADHAVYGDVVAEVTAYLTARAEQARAAGVADVWIDPGLGFAKTAAHNLSLLRHLDRLVATGWPVAVGASRKSFLGRLTARDGVIPPPSDRLEASVATAAWAMAAGAALVRVHDVAPVAMVRRLAAPEPDPTAGLAQGTAPVDQDRPNHQPGDSEQQQGGRGAQTRRQSPTATGAVR